MAQSTTIQFDDGTNKIAVETTMFGYRTRIILPFDIQEISNGKYEIYDASNTYDIYECDCTFELNETQQGTLIDFLEDSSKGRASNSIEMTLATGSGFFPFGPHKGDAGVFTVAIPPQHVRRRGIQMRPFRYFQTDLKLVNQGSFPSYSLPTDVKDGLWSLGTVDEIRYPPGRFGPDIRLSAHGSMGWDGAIDNVDRGNSSDRENTQFTIVSNEEKAGRIISYLVNTSRGSTFAMQTLDKYYAFGYSAASSATYNARLIQSELEITHESHNRFVFDLNVNLDSTA
jgi:hypothetical protein